MVPARMHSSVQRPEVSQLLQDANNLFVTVTKCEPFLRERLNTAGVEKQKSLKCAVQRLEEQLKQAESDKQLQRYRALQQDLKERDQAAACLRKLLLDGPRKWTAQEIDVQLDKALGTADVTGTNKSSASSGQRCQHVMLYGASRELLLRENRVLRAQLEQRLITTRTCRTTNDVHSDTKLSQRDANSPLKGKNRVQDKASSDALELLQLVVEGAAHLQDTAQKCTPRTVSNAAIQVDDGTIKMCTMLQEQATILAGQKAQLLNKVAEMETAMNVKDQRIEALRDEVASLRQQKTELLTHQSTLSVDIRQHLASETQRAETAERQVKEASAAAKEAGQKMAALSEQLAKVKAEHICTLQTLTEKNKEVAGLQSSYEQLAGIIDNLATQLTNHLQTNGQQRVLEAMQLNHKELSKETKATAATASAIIQSVKAVAEKLTSVTNQQTQTQGAVNICQESLSVIHKDIDKVQKLVMSSTAGQAQKQGATQSSEASKHPGKELPNPSSSQAAAGTANPCQLSPSALATASQTSQHTPMVDKQYGEAAKQALETDQKMDIEDFVVPSEWDKGVRAQLARMMASPEKSVRRDVSHMQQSPEVPDNARARAFHDTVAFPVQAKHMAGSATFTPDHV